MDLDTVEELIQRGARVNVEDMPGRRVIQREVKVDVEDKSGREPAHFAAYCPLPFLQCLVKAGASLDATDTMGRNLLHVGVLGGRIDVVKYIIQERNEFVNAGDMNGWTPLMWAVRVCREWGVETSQRAAIIQELLERGADRLAQGSEYDRSWTAHKLAVYYGLDNDIVQLVTPNNDEHRTLDREERGRWECAIKNQGRRAYQHDGYCSFCFTVSFPRRTCIWVSVKLAVVAWLRMFSPSHRLRAMCAVHSRSQADSDRHLLAHTIFATTATGFASALDATPPSARSTLDTTLTNPTLLTSMNLMAINKATGKGV